MKSHHKKELMFGDLVASVYGACSRRKAQALVLFAVNALLIVFRVPQRFVISRSKCFAP